MLRIHAVAPRGNGAGARWRCRSTGRTDAVAPQLAVRQRPPKTFSVATGRRRGPFDDVAAGARPPSSVLAFGARAVARPSWTAGEQKRLAGRPGRSRQAVVGAAGPGKSPAASPPSCGGSDVTPVAAPSASTGSAAPAAAAAARVPPRRPARAVAVAAMPHLPAERRRRELVFVRRGRPAGKGPIARRRDGRRHQSNDTFVTPWHCRRVGSSDGRRLRARRRVLQQRAPGARLRARPRGVSAVHAVSPCHAWRRSALTVCAGRGQTKRAWQPPLVEVATELSAPRQSASCQPPPSGSSSSPRRSRSSDVTRSQT